MKKKQKLLTKQNEEILSLNESIMNIFVIDELEQRLQMSAAKPWRHECTCNVDECTPLGTCQCNVDYPIPPEDI